MRDDHLAAIQPLLERLVALLARQDARPLVQEEAMLRLRGELRKLLASVRTGLGRSVTEREVYLALFPLVVHLDEIVQTSVVDTDRLSWPMLQKELFDTDKGGQLFYRALDEILEARVAPFIYQVYYFCLRLGFRGQLVGEEERVSQYLRKLQERFPAAPVGTAAISLVEPGMIPRSHSPVWYYLPALLLVAAVFFLTQSLASSQAEALMKKEQEPFRSGAAAVLRPAPQTRAAATTGALSPALAESTPSAQRLLASRAPGPVASEEESDFPEQDAECSCRGKDDEGEDQDEADDPSRESTSGPPDQIAVEEEPLDEDPRPRRVARRLQPVGRSTRQ